MLWELDPKTTELLERLKAFFDTHIYPNEARYEEDLHKLRVSGNPWQASALVEELKPLARKAGLWNLFLPHSERAPDGLSNFAYAPLCEVMGRVHLVFRGVQLFGARHRQHGDDRALRHAKRTRIGGWSRCCGARSVRRS